MRGNTPRRPRRSMRILPLLLLVMGQVSGACSSEDASCGAFGKVCLKDDTTCACVPSCDADQDCNKYSLCKGDAGCLPCASYSCHCSYGHCLPLHWEQGEHVSFK
jgi:hypothetical protein